MKLIAIAADCQMCSCNKTNFQQQSSLSIDLDLVMTERKHMLKFRWN